MQQPNENAEAASPGEKQAPQALPEFPALKKAEELLLKLEEKEKNILEKETQLDKKFKELEAKAVEARISGHGVIKTEPSEEQKKEAAARNMLKGTGFERYMP